MNSTTNIDRLIHLYEKRVLSKNFVLDIGYLSNYHFIKDESGMNGGMINAKIIKNEIGDASKAGSEEKQKENVKDESRKKEISDESQIDSRTCTGSLLEASCQKESPENVLYVAGMTAGSSVNGPGMRFCVFVQGCNHHCSGCQNPETHKYKFPQTRRCIAEVSEVIERFPYCSGLTISGGEPFDQAEGVAVLLDRLREFLQRCGWDVWVWSGYTMQEILQDPIKKRLLDKVDVLVDGRFIQDLPPSKWRGSNNQRIWKKQKDGSWNKSKE